MSYGQVGGKQAVTRTRSEPTNVGRSNERNGEAQAEFEAQAAWQKKIDEGYFKSKEEAETNVVRLPMLAHSFEKDVGGKKVKHDIPYPVNTQRKYNGLRCLATPQSLTSRQGIDWDIPHIKEHVKLFIGAHDSALDGEIYIHGTPLQTLNRLIKRTRPGTEKLEYHVYDYPFYRGIDGANTAWTVRCHWLLTEHAAYLQKCKDAGVKPVIMLAGVDTCHNEGELRAKQKQYINEGYEGLIIRTLTGRYSWNNRSHDLLKFKEFQDEEFEVVGATPRELILDGVSTPIIEAFECRNNVNNLTFRAVPRGDVETRAEYWKKRKSLIGKKLTVRFLERSVDGLPQGNTVGLHFRLSKDLPKE